MNLYVIIDADQNKIDTRKTGYNKSGIRVYLDYNTAEIALRQMIKTDVKSRNYRIAEYIESK
jgi:hypothetical protein